MQYIFFGAQGGQHLDAIGWANTGLMLGCALSHVLEGLTGKFIIGNDFVGVDELNLAQCLLIFLR